MSDERNQSTPQLRNYLDGYVVVNPFPPSLYSEQHFSGSQRDQEHKILLISPRSRGMESHKAFPLLVRRVRDGGVGPGTVSIVLKVGGEGKERIGGKSNVRRQSRRWLSGRWLCSLIQGQSAYIIRVWIGDCKDRFRVSSSMKGLLTSKITTVSSVH